MRSVSELETLLHKYSIDLCGPPVPHMKEVGGYYVFVKVVYGKSGRRIPSEGKLREIRDSVSESGFSVNFITVEETDGDNFDDLRILLNRRYGENIRNVFLTRSPNVKWIVWIEMNNMAGDELQSSIQSTVHDYMRLCELNLRDIVFVGNQNLPTPTAILRTLRILAPASPETIEKALAQRGFVVPNQTWLNQKLDRIRKVGLVVRRKDGRYFLSVTGLSSLGTSKGREGADVRRALAVWKILQ